MAIEMSSINGISDLEDLVDCIIYDLHPSTTSSETLMIALELRALRWALVGRPVDNNLDSAVDRLVVTIDNVADYLSDKSDEVVGAIDGITEAFLPPASPSPFWYRCYRWLRD